MIEAELQRLLINYGNASFHCGAHKDDDSVSYRRVFKECMEAKRALLEYIEKRLAPL